MQIQKHTPKVKAHAKMKNTAKPNTQKSKHMQKEKRPITRTNVKTCAKM